MKINQLTPFLVTTKTTVESGQRPWLIHAESAEVLSRNWTKRYGRPLSVVKADYFDVDSGEWKLGEK